MGRGLGYALPHLLYVDVKLSEGNLGWTARFTRSTPSDENAKKMCTQEGKVHFVNEILLPVSFRSRVNDCDRRTPNCF